MQYLIRFINEKKGSDFEIGLLKEWDYREDQENEVPENQDDNDATEADEAEEIEEKEKELASYWPLIEWAVLRAVAEGESTTKELLWIIMPESQTDWRAESLNGQINFSASFEEAMIEIQLIPLRSLDPGKIYESIQSL